MLSELCQHNQGVFSNPHCNTLAWGGAAVRAFRRIVLDWASPLPSHLLEHFDFASLVVSISVVQVIFSPQGEKEC